MKFNISTSQDYTAPTVDIVEAVVEQGFTASYGEAGDAGDDFDVNDNGIF